jgi:hypothetical protein
MLKECHALNENSIWEGHALNENSISTANIVFQSYDYTSSMSGIFKGCQAKMKEHLGRKVPYFPCLAYCVNTTVKHSCEASTAACHMFEILQEVFALFLRQVLNGIACFARKLVKEMLKMR